MILDGFLTFTGGSPNSGTVTVGNGGDQPTTGGPLTSSNIIDLGNSLEGVASTQIPSSAAGGGARDVGIGDDPMLKVLVEVTTAFASGTSLQVSVTGAPDNGSGAPGTFTPMAFGPVVAVANLIQGAQICDIDVPRPAPGQPLPRFLQLQYTIVGTFTGGGTVKGYIVLDRFDQIGSQSGILSGYTPGVTIPN